MFINEPQDSAAQDSEEELSIFKLLLGARSCATHFGIKNSKHGSLPSRCVQSNQANKAT